MDDVRRAIERTYREEAGRVLAVLIGELRDFDLAEEVFQEAVTAALEAWPRDGLPRRPGAWLTTTARRRAIDRLRRAAVRSERQDELRVLAELERGEAEEEVEREIPDERLRLIFTCCHPALPRSAQVALTLRTLGGLTTPEIARAFLVPEATLAQRLVRAKRKLRSAGIPYRVPPRAELPARLEPVLAVVYLVFNEGYGASSGDTPLRRDLCAEAIRLGRVLASLLPREPEVLGLLALMLLHDSRSEARLDAAGRWVSLEEQDRALWKRDQIAEGLEALERARALGRPEPYQLQAAISAVHARSGTFERTDWPAIVALYEALERFQPSPVVTLNRAVALAMAEGAAAGLALLEGAALGRRLARYQPYHAARADLLRRAGRRPEAAAAYRRALELTGVEAERAYLTRRLAALGTVFSS